MLNIQDLTAIPVGEKIRINDDMIVIVKGLAEGYAGQPNAEIAAGYAVLVEANGTSRYFLIHTGEDLDVIERSLDTPDKDMFIWRKHHIQNMSIPVNQQENSIVIPNYDWFDLRIEAIRALPEIIEWWDGHEKTPY